MSKLTSEKFNGSGGQNPDYAGNKNQILQIAKPVWAMYVTPDTYDFQQVYYVCLLCDKNEKKQNEKIIPII